MSRFGSGSSCWRGHRAPVPTAAHRPRARVSGHARLVTMAGSLGVQLLLLTAADATAGALGAARTTRAKGFCGENFHHKSLFFRHKLTFVVTFKIATSHHKYSPHKYSSDDFLFPTNGCTH